MTVYGQSLTHPNCQGLHYTDAQDKKCLECLINSPKKDSLINNLSLQIINFRTVVSNANDQKVILNDQVSALKKDLKVTNIKLKISKRLTFFGVPIALGGGFVIGFLLR